MEVSHKTIMANTKKFQPPVMLVCHEVELLSQMFLDRVEIIVLCGKY